MSPAWVRFLRAQAEITHEMDARLRERHGVSLREYEILLALGDDPNGRRRRVDLSAMVFLTQSGITRILDRLERAGLVGKAASEEDRRVTYAELTTEGWERLRAARRSHRADIRELFEARFDDSELDTLDELLARLPGAEAAEDWRA